MYANVVRRGLVSIACLLVSGLSLTTMACSAPPSSLNEPANDRSNDDDNNDDSDKSTPKEQSNELNERDEDERPSNTQSLVIDVASEISVNPGETVRLKVSLERGSGLKGAGTLSVTGLPSSVEVEPVAVDENETSGELVFVAGRNAVAGRHNAIVRAKIGSVEKTANLSFTVGEGSSESEDWCGKLAECCDEMTSLTERLLCVANVGVSENDACMVHALAYVAKGDCSISTR